jgi:hypothetical protein
MHKTILIFLFLALLTICCNESNSVSYDNDTPAWLRQKIDDMSVNINYYGARIYRYEWTGKYIYHIMIPISSCAYCEVYDQFGNKVIFKDDYMFQDFITNKKNEIIIWEWDN